MMSLFVTRSPLKTKEFSPRGANNFLSELRSPLAQWVKHLPVDLAVQCSSPARGGIFSTVNGVHCTQPFIINSHRPDDLNIEL